VYYRKLKAILIFYSLSGTRHSDLPALDKPGAIGGTASQLPCRNGHIGGVLIRLVIRTIISLAYEMAELHLAGSDSCDLSGETLPVFVSESSQARLI
jgi:hypothetical protein